MILTLTDEIDKANDRNSGLNDHERNENGKCVNNIYISCIKMLSPPYADWCIFAYQPCWKRVLEHTVTNWIVIGCRAQSTFIYIELYTLYTLISNQIVILKFSTTVNIRKIIFFNQTDFFLRKISSLIDLNRSAMDHNY